MFFTASWALCPCHRPETVDLASAAFAVASPVLVLAAQPVEAVVVRAAPAAVGPVAGALAEPAHVASAVAVADVLHAVLVDSEPVLIHDAFVVVAAAAAGQLHVAVPVSVVLVLRLVRPVAVVVAQVAPHVQPAAHFAHVPLVAVRSAVVAAVVAAVAPCDVVRGVYLLTHAAVEQIELAVEEQPVVAPSAVHRVHDAHLAPGTSVPSHAQAPHSRGGPSPDLVGIAALLVLCS